MICKVQRWYLIWSQVWTDAEKGGKMLTAEEKMQRVERMQAKKAVVAPWMALVDDHVNDQGEDSKHRKDEEHRRRKVRMQEKKVAAAESLAVVGVAMTNDSMEGNTSPAGAAPVGKERVEETSWGSGRSDTEVAESLLATSQETGSEGVPADPDKHSKSPVVEEPARTLKKPREKEEHAVERIGSPRGKEGSVSHGMECRLVSEPESDRKASFCSSALGCEHVCEHVRRR
jgi:hypothetical protein